MGKQLFFVLLCLIKIISLNAAIEGDKCQRNTDHDVDQGLFVQDFGPKGVRGTVNVTMSHTMQPGAVVSVVTKSNIRGNVNLISEDIYVIHIDARIGKSGALNENELVMATSTYLNLVWNPDQLVLANPVLRGAKTTTTLVYEVEGFRVFINGREVAFYKHRTSRRPSVINVNHDVVYKVLYLTTIGEQKASVTVPGAQ